MTLSQILFPIVVLIGLFGIVTGILNSYDQFSIPALTPVFWNLAIIVGLVVGVPRADTDERQALRLRRLDRRRHGDPAAAPAALAARPRRPPAARARRARSRPCKQVFKLMLPVMLGLGLINVNAVIGTVFASKLIDPTIAPNAIDKAFRIYMLPQGMFSVAVATVLYPSLARLATRGDMAGFRGTVASGLRQINFLLVPAARRLDRARRADRAARSTSAARSTPTRRRSWPARSPRSRSGSPSTG